MVADTRHQAQPGPGRAVPDRPEAPRLARDPKHLDSQVDVAGYAAILREVSR